MTGSFVMAGNNRVARAQHEFSAGVDHLCLSSVWFDTVCTHTQHHRNRFTKMISKLLQYIYIYCASIAVGSHGNPLNNASASGDGSGQHSQKKLPPLIQYPASLFSK